MTVGCGRRRSARSLADDSPYGSVGCAACPRRRRAEAHASPRRPRPRRRAHGPVRRLGDAGAVRGRAAGARRGAHRARACSTSRTWGRSRRAARARREFLRHLLTNDIEKVAGGRRAVLAALPRGRRRARRPVHLPVRRATSERFLTVVNASNADTDFAWFAQQADGWDGRRGDRPLGRLRDARPAGAAGDRAPCAAARGHELPERFRFTRGDASPACRRSSAAPATRARTASSCCSSPRTRRAVWDALIDAGATPAGLGARDTLRLEVCYPLYGNDLSTDRTPIEAGLELGLRARQGLRRRRAAARAGGAGHRREARRRSCSPGPGIPRAGCAVLRRRRARSAW